MKSDTAVAWPGALLAIFAAYVLLGFGAFHLAIPPGYAMPLFPPAGIALAGVMVYGWRMLPAVWLGGFAVNLIFGLMRNGFDPQHLLLPAAIGLGATLQAGAGAWLMQRFQGASPTLTEPAEVARLFLLGGALACTLSAGVATLALLATHTLPVAQGPANWLTWWMGDMMGVVIAAPIVLTLVGQPRAVWQARRLSVAVPMLLVTLLAVAAIDRARHWDEERARAVFDRDARSAYASLNERLQDPLSALEAMYGLFIGSDDVSRLDFHRAAQAWLEGPAAVEGIGWSERVEPGQLAAFESLVRRDGRADYGVFRPGPAGQHLPPEGREFMPIRYFEPDARGGPLLGRDSLAGDFSRQAIEIARSTGQPAASAGFTITRDKPGQTALTVYRAVYAQPEVPSERRLSQTRGAVFVVVRIEDMMRTVAAGLPDYLDVCLIDASPTGVKRRLAGDIGCENRGDVAVQHLSDLPFAGRHWELRVATRNGGLPLGDSQGTWLFASISLLATAVFGALLLTMTGRAHRIEAAVGERTAALQREIEERARTEAALRDSEQRLRNILDHVPIGVMYTDMRGHIKQSNPKFRQLVGYDSEELSQRRSLDLIHPEDRNAALEHVAELTRGDISFYQRQSRYVRRDGKVLWVRAVVSLLRDEDGKPHRIVAVLEDIGEHLRLRDAEDAREMAEAANNAKNDFLSRMSQELRAPLAAMLGFAELIERDREHPASRSQRDWIGQIQGAASHLLDMVDDTLDLSRVESGTLGLQAETLELVPLVQAALVRIEPQARRRGLIVTQQLADDARTARGDAERVTQILVRLLGNAATYNQERGRIHVEARVAGAMVELVVSDTGPGMSSEQVQSLFMPFSGHRFGNAPGHAASGLGLVISRRLAELMHGSLDVRSVEGQGSSFILRLPRQLLRDLPQPSGPISVFDQYNPGYRQRIVHYIEDNETNALVMEGILAQRPQVKLRVSENGLDGLAAIRSRPPSMILLDMHLPDIDGLQLLRMLKDDPATQPIPVVVVSADAVVERVQAALAAGAEYYLTKPVNVTELLRLVDGVLEPRDTLFG